MILSDFTCPVHGRFEALADADADTMPCPTKVFANRIGAHSWEDACHNCGQVRCGCTRPCGALSPWSPSPIFGRVELVSATRGKWELPPTKQHCDTTPLMEGQSMREWKADRTAMWREHDRAKRKGRL